MPDQKRPEAYSSGPMWLDFGMTRASYLVLPRVLLCGMPVEWQERMVALLDEARDTYDTDAIDDNYSVTLRSDNGRFKKDPLAHYRHPGKLPYKEPK